MNKWKHETMINSKENLRKNCNNITLLGSIANKYFHCYNNEDLKCGHNQKSWQLCWMNKGVKKEGKKRVKIVSQLMSKIN